MNVYKIILPLILINSYFLQAQTSFEEPINHLIHKNLHGSFEEFTKGTNKAFLVTGDEVLPAIVFIRGDYVSMVNTYMTNRANLRCEDIYNQVRRPSNWRTLKVGCKQLSQGKSSVNTPLLEGKVDVYKVNDYRYNKLLEEINNEGREQRKARIRKALEQKIGVYQSSFDALVTYNKAKDINVTEGYNYGFLYQNRANGWFVEPVKVNIRYGKPVSVKRRFDDFFKPINEILASGSHSLFKEHHYCSIKFKDNDVYEADAVIVSKKEYEDLVYTIDKN